MDDDMGGMDDDMSDMPMGGDDDDSFCGGSMHMAMDMNMGGFSSIFDDDQPCTNFLFRTWTLDNPTKFAFGCLGAVAMGVATELLTKARRSAKAEPLHPLLQTPLQQSACMLALYAVQVIMGYALMLVVMTYNAELFLCSIAGLVIGHGLFNLQAPVADKTDPCCQYDDLPNDAR